MCPNKRVLHAADLAEVYLQRFMHCYSVAADARL